MKRLIIGLLVVALLFIAGCGTGITPEDKIIVECAEPILWEFSFVFTPDWGFISRADSHKAFLIDLALEDIFLFEDEHPFEEFDDYIRYKADYYREFFGWGHLPPQDIIEAQILDLINQARAEEGLSELTLDPDLYEIALEYCKEMHQENVFTHDDFEAREDSIRSNGYTLVGENLARGYDSPQALVGAWLLSPGHKENIMNPLFFYTGLAHYEGFTCQVFGGYDLEPFFKPLIPLGLWP